MNHVLFITNPDNEYSVAVLIKDRALHQADLRKHYVDPLVNLGVPEDSILSLSLKYNEHNKAPAKLIKEHLQAVLMAADKLKITTLVVADSSYFKTLTKQTKADPHFGYVLPCAIKGFEHINIVVTINYQNLFYNPGLQQKLDMSLNTVVHSLQGTDPSLGQGIIKHAEYPETYEEIEAFLNKLHQYPALVCDIEAFSLIFSEAGIGTISFAWNQNEGGAFLVDYKQAPFDTYIDDYMDGYPGMYVPNHGIRQVLLEFFLAYKGKLLYHNGTYDIKVLIYNLFMKDLLDNEGLIHGLETMYRDVDDVMIITYLATNTTAGNVLGLKQNAFEFAGNYAEEDIKDIRRIPKDDLLEYNLIDCLSTWFVHNKNYPIMVADQQLEVYEEIFLPSMPVVTHMELTGMPMYLDKSKELKEYLTIIQDRSIKILNNSSVVKQFAWKEQCKAMVTANLLLKKKVKPLSDFKTELNPGSPKQVALLLHEPDYMNLPILDTTATGLPATGQKTILKHLNSLIIQYGIKPEELT